MNIRTDLVRAISTEQAERRLQARLDGRLEFALLRHTTTRGEPMTFARRPYLLPIYLDRSRERVFRKSVQCGISELLIIDALESADRGLACLYVMPTQEKRQKFVANRVDRAIRASRFYRSRLRSGAGRANTVGLKHFGPGVISFVGSNADNEFVEFPADLVIVDEYDRCMQRNMPLVRDRLAASPHKLAVVASTPTVAGFGVAPLFDASDAKEWHVHCQTCGEWQPLDFFVNVCRREGDDAWELLDREWATAPDGDMHRNPLLQEQKGNGTCPRAARDVHVMCRKCGRPLDRLGPGEWVARHPDRDVSGYHVSQLFVPTCRVSDLWHDWGKALRSDWERQRFHNSLLGEPYTAEGGGLAREGLFACRRDYEMPPSATGCTMGVDVGKWFHVRVSDQPEPGVRRAVFIGRVQTTDELDRLMHRYDVQCCVVDAQPEAHLIRHWQAAHKPGRIWRCVYSDDDVRELRKDRTEGIVRVARTPALDDATDDIVCGRNWLPRNAETLDDGDYIAQMLAPVRQLETDARGNPRYVWTKPAADHHRHADAYDKLASRLCAPAASAVRIVTGPASRVFPRSPGRVFRAA